MKIKISLLLIIFFNIFLNSCSSNSKEGVYYIKHNICRRNMKRYCQDKRNVEECKKNICETQIYLNHNSFEYLKNDELILIEFPYKVQRGIGGGMDVPTLLPFLLRKYPKFEDNNEVFYIDFENPNYNLQNKNCEKQNEYFINLKKDLKIFLNVNNKKYESDFLFNLSSGIRLSFPPLKIKYVKKGTLIIEYKNIKKEIDFEYGFKWFYYH